MRTFYDAIHPANIPVTAQGVCGYVDGKYAWSAADWARFPHSVKVRIAVFSSTADGHVLDVEAGCSTPANAPGWVVRRRAVGVDPTVYCSLSAWPTVRAAFKSAGVAEPHWWIAAYPGNGPNLYPGSIAHQWQNPGPVDISVVADYWPGVDPAPAPVVKPAPKPKSTRNIPMTKAIQRAVHVAADGMWGPGTQAAATAVIRRTLTNVRYLQARVGTKVDGIWGPNSEAARISTVRAIQRAIGVKPDGDWGPISSRAWAHAVANNLNRY